MLPGRLGLESASIPQADRHGLIWLANGRLWVESGCLRFETAGCGGLAPGTYAIPYQSVSLLALEPGTSLTHDVLRLCARHGVAIAAVGEGGVRLYTAPPLSPDRSDVARRHARAWADEDCRLALARRLYAWRFKAVLPSQDIEVLRGIEGARARRSYELIAKRHGVHWKGRNYDRSAPELDDLPNQAINHASAAVVSAAALAVATVGAIPQLGFIHEHSGEAFVLDIADLYRDEVTLPCAFRAVKESARTGMAIERQTRKLCVEEFRRTGLVAAMIDRVKELFDVGTDSRGGAQSE